MDLRNSPSDGSQRMLNAIEPGTPLPIHRHMKSSETVVCLRGHLREVFYNEAGEVTEVIDLQPCGDLHPHRPVAWRGGPGKRHCDPGVQGRGV